MEAALPVLAGVPALCYVQHLLLAVFPVSPSCLRSISLQLQHRWDYRSFNTYCTALLNSLHLYIYFDGLGLRAAFLFLCLLNERQGVAQLEVSQGCVWLGQS